MKLNFFPLTERPDLAPPCIVRRAAALPQPEAVQIAEIDPAYADGALLSEHYGVPYETELNCLIIEGTRSENKRYAAVVVPYGKRAHTGSAVKQALDAKKISFAPLAYVLAATGMEFGSITPFGLPEDWQILIDSAVLKQENVIIGGGLAKSKIMLPSALLAAQPGAVVIEGLAKD